jgi:hypothetical protein
MVLVDSIQQLDYFNPHPMWGCYAEPVIYPSDIMLQVQMGTADPTIGGLLTMPSVRVLKPDGTFIEDAGGSFRIRMIAANIGGTTYYYTNIVCNSYSPGMLSNGCFVLEIKVYNGTGAIGWHYYTQKYQIFNSAVPVTGVTIFPTTGAAYNLATLCGADPLSKTCSNYAQLVAEFDCIDSFTGDYYGDGTVVLSNTLADFTFTRLSNIAVPPIEGGTQKLKVLPSSVKRTLSINCRTQRTERTKKYQLLGHTWFPQWKMEEIEGMLLANHLFVDGVEYQSDGGAPFTQLGEPKSGHYAYKLVMDLQDCYEWQVFGCTPQCEPMSYYYPIAF